MEERSAKGAADAVEAALQAQAEGLGLMAWFGAKMMDHMLRTGAEVAGFARSEARRDLETLQAMASCGSMERVAELRQTYLQEKLTAYSTEAERLARMNAETCDVTLDRLSDWRD